MTRSSKQLIAAGAALLAIASGATCYAARSGVLDTSCSVRVTAVPLHLTTTELTEATMVNSQEALRATVTNGRGKPREGIAVDFFVGDRLGPRSPKTGLRLGQRVFTSRTNSDGLATAPLSAFSIKAAAFAGAKSYRASVNFLACSDVASDPAPITYTG